MKFKTINGWLICCGFILGTLFAQSVNAQTSTTEVEDRWKSRPGGLFVEPALKYETLSGDLDYPAPLSHSKVRAEGFGVSARLGVHVSDIVFLALEGNYAQLGLNEDYYKYSARGDAFSYGPTLGVQTPWVGVRLWGTYLIGGEYNPGSSQGIDLRFKDLKGYRIGAGVRVVAVSASLEYQDAMYDTTEIQNAPLISGNLESVDMTQRGWILGVSFPLSM